VNPEQLAYIVEQRLNNGLLDAKYMVRTEGPDQLLIIADIKERNAELGTEKKIRNFVSQVMFDVMLRGFVTDYNIKVERRPR
jgi:hypothetical protein